MRIAQRELLLRLQAKHPKMSMADLRSLYKDLFEVMMESVADGDEVFISGFGSFEARNYAPRMGRNVIKDKPVVVPAQRRPHFKVGRTFKQLVNGK